MLTFEVHITNKLNKIQKVEAMLKCKIFILEQKMRGNGNPDPTIKFIIHIQVKKRINRSYIIVESH